MSGPIIIPIIKKEGTEAIHQSDQFGSSFLKVLKYTV